MVKTQVQLPEDDLAELRRLAAELGVSVSELVRRGVRQVLSSRKRPTRRELMERALQITDKFHSGKHDIAEEHDRHLAEDLAR